MRGSIVFPFLLVLSVTACLATLITLKNSHLFRSAAKGQEAFSYYSELLIKDAENERTCNGMRRTSSSPAVTLCLAKRSKESLLPLFKWSEFVSYHKPCSFPQKNHLVYKGAMSEFTCSIPYYSLTNSYHYRENLQIESLSKAGPSRLSLSSYGSITIENLHATGDLLIIAGGSVSISNVTSITGPVIVYSATGNVEVRQVTGVAPLMVMDEESIPPAIKKLIPLPQFSQIPLALLYNFSLDQTQ